ncbi:MAG: EF-hand domain-containing protein [Burkholderiaceae bacterium]|jgi:hypothetical protein
MLKVALVSATILVAASAAHAANTDLESSAPAPVAAPCHPVQSMDLDCALRVIDANGDGTVSAAELASFATPAPPVVDWTPLRPPHSTGLDFKDAATEPASVLHATLDQDDSHRLIPALFALGALVILLRKRPV